MASISRYLRIAKAVIIAPVNTAVRITLVSFLLSELITTVLTLIVFGSFSKEAFIIAGVCSTLLPYLVSSRLIEQQRLIEERNQQLQGLTEELRLANAELSERNAQLDAFSHTVAHDLQTPLSALTGLSRLLEENYTRVSPEAVRQHLQMIGHTTEKMSHIVEELLLLSQIEDIGELHVERLDMAAIVQEVIDYFSLLLDEKQAHIIVPGSWPAAVGYGPWVEQVWLNYISNALKYGGRPPVVQLGATVSGDMVRFWVKDNGAGLSPAEQQQLFVPYRRLHETRAQGHGLGLSIVRTIIDRLGGTAGVESSGKGEDGCCFYFTLPRAATNRKLERSVQPKLASIASPMPPSRATDPVLLSPAETHASHQPQ